LLSFKELKTTHKKYKTKTVKEIAVKIKEFITP